MFERQPISDRQPRTQDRILKYHMTSLGCPKNLVESEEMMAKLSISGMVLVHDPDEADLIVVNTCGFIDSAKEESVNTILDLAQIRQKNPWQRLVVVGCLVQRYRKELIEEFPEVDAFVGVQDKESFVKVAWESLGQRQPNLMPSPVPFTPRLLTTEPHMAYLRISDGCSHTCTFCAIPSFRGKHRSRPLEDILNEARALVAGGVKELVVVSQDSSSYGYELYGKFILHELLARLEEIEGVEWIRVMYLYPHLVSKDIAKAFARSEKLVSYVDMPIQHADPSILKAMKRGSDDTHIRRALERLRDARKDLTVRTTVMVGFPGEKNEHFQNMLARLEEWDFDRVGVFQFSREDGTPSANMPDQVSDRIKEKRYRTLIDWSLERAREKNQQLVGEMLNVLIERKDPEGDGYWGRYYGQAPDVDGQVYVRGGKLMTGCFAPVRIAEADEDNLYGYVNTEIRVVQV